MIDNKDYLGDGVYALHTDDRPGIWLLANGLEDATDRIFLEPEVFEAVKRFWARVHSVDETPEGAFKVDKDAVLKCAENLIDVYDKVCDQYRNIVEQEGLGPIEEDEIVTKMKKLLGRLT
jgi:hypothetical protein